MARRLELHSWDGLPGTAERGRAWALVQGDCIGALEKLPPHSVDVAFADPPYMLSNGGTTCQSGKRASVNKGRWDESRGIAEDHAFQSRLAHGGPPRAESRPGRSGCPAPST